MEIKLVKVVVLVEIKNRERYEIKSCLIHMELWQDADTLIVVALHKGLSVCSSLRSLFLLVEARWSSIIPGNGHDVMNSFSICQTFFYFLSLWGPGHRIKLSHCQMWSIISSNPQFQLKVTIRCVGFIKTYVNKSKSLTKTMTIDHPGVGDGFDFIIPVQQQG